MLGLHGRIIRHERNMDVCYMVMGMVDTGKKYKMKVTCINMGYVESYPLAVDLKFDIKKQDVFKWHKCLDPDAKCLRHAEWRRLNEEG